jgi:hypothetical protein
LDYLFLQKYFRFFFLNFNPEKLHQKSSLNSEHLKMQSTSCYIFLNESQKPKLEQKNILKPFCVDYPTSQPLCATPGVGGFLEFFCDQSAEAASHRVRGRSS